MMRHLSLPAPFRNAILWMLLPAVAAAQEPDEGSLDLPRDEQLTSALEQIVADLQLDGDFETEDGPEQISLAVVDLSTNPPRLAGVNPENFIYPASVYKMYVAAEVLRRVEQSRGQLNTPVEVSEVNAVDRRKEIPSDPRPLLTAGQTVTVGYLLDLMITRSDNTAANCLIDFVKRPNINALIRRYGWEGSEVTRKFLARSAEDPGYAEVPGTETCALHTAEFLVRIDQRRLVSPWVSMQLESLLGRQLDKSKLARGLPAGTMYYHKTGWYADWTHDVGIIDTGRTRFVICCYLPLAEETGAEKLKQLGERVFEVMTAEQD